MMSYSTQGNISVRPSVRLCVHLSIRPFFWGALKGPQSGSETLRSFRGAKETLKSLKILKITSGSIKGL